ncbi:MAG TPA: DUF3606 domain-containing protein [Bacteriovoracaceae bacterium]|nr:DUF3606 domain-containing protein [Bacteriovoracaceae bacterium]
MPDSKTNRGRRDGQRINVHEDYELRYWSQKFKVTKENLIKVVSKAGVMVEDVKKALNKN